MRQKEQFIQEIKRRSCQLHDNQSFIERLMKPVKKFIPHDASGTTVAKGAGFDSSVANYGYPPAYLIKWANLAKSDERFQRFFREGPQRGYLTLRSSEYMPDFYESEEYRALWEPFHLKYGIMTMFFDRNGSPMGIYACNRLTESLNKTDFSREEKDGFDTISPYIFYSYRRYKWLLGFDFFNLASLEPIMIGVITADLNGRITWMNEAARQVLDAHSEAVPARVTGHLKSAWDALNSVYSSNDRLSFAFRDIGHPCSSSCSILCYRFDEQASSYLPVTGNGFVFFLDARHIDQDIIGALSGREREVVRLLARGMQDKEIADALSLSEKTIQTYVQNVFHKLGVSNRTEAAIIALKLRG